MALSTLYNDTEPIPPMVSAFTAGWGFVNEGPASTPPVSSTNTFASRAYYQPTYIPTTTIATRMWWANGATVSASYNVEAGLYRDTGAAKPGAKLWTTGSTAQGTASSIQFVDISPDIRLDVGLYWLYWVCDNTSATFMRSSATLSAWAELLAFTQSGVTLGSAPDPAAPGEVSANSNHWLMGFSTNTVT